MDKLKYCGDTLTYDSILPAAPTGHESARPPHFSFNILIKPDSCLHTTYSIFIATFAIYFLALAPSHSENSGVWSSSIEESHFYITSRLDNLCNALWCCSKHLLGRKLWSLFLFFCWVPKVVLDPIRPCHNKRTEILLVCLWDCLSHFCMIKLTKTFSITVLW